MSKSKKVIWGMTGNSHDASLAVFVEEQGRTVPVWARLAKEYSTNANEPHITKELISAATEIAGRPDQVVWYEKPFLKTLRQFRAGQGWLRNENNIRTYLQERGIDAPISYTKHHLSHAAYAYYTQPYSNCAVICLDSIGEFETLTIWKGQSDWTLKKMYSQGYPHSLGLFYSSMTKLIGLTPQRDEYMIASMGDNVAIKPNDIIQDIYAETLELQTEKPYIRLKQNLHIGCEYWLEPSLNITKNEIAYATQSVFEDCVRHLSLITKARTNLDYLALAGGGALNRRAVDNIRNQWYNIHVPPNPGDPGSAVGAVLARNSYPVSIDGIWETKG